MIAHLEENRVVVTAFIRSAIKEVRRGHEREIGGNFFGDRPVGSMES